MELHIFTLRKNLNHCTEEMNTEAMITLFLKKSSENADDMRHERHRVLADALNPFLPDVALKLPEELGFDFGIIHSRSVDEDNNFSFKIMGYRSSQRHLDVEKQCSLSELLELNPDKLKIPLQADKLEELKLDAKKAREHNTKQENEYQLSKKKLGIYKANVKQAREILGAFLCPFYIGDHVEYRPGKQAVVRRVLYDHYTPWGYKLILREGGKSVHFTIPDLLAYNQDLVLNNLAKKQAEADTHRSNA